MIRKYLITFLCNLAIKVVGNTVKNLFNKKEKKNTVKDKDTVWMYTERKKIYYFVNLHSIITFITVIYVM